MQSNFPYNNELHEFFVACSTNTVDGTMGEIIGFVDVDSRPLDKSKEKDGPPRPYLSDLAVHTGWRRKGVARALIQKCEEKAKTWKKCELYLRVEEKNQPALQMYHSLGYDAIPHHFFGVKDTTILLKREIEQIKNKDEISVEMNGMVIGDNSQQVLDYIV